MSETDAIDTNKYCVCFATHEDDVKEENGHTWIECSCGWWLHEDRLFSVSPAMPDELCPYSVRQIFCMLSSLILPADEQNEMF